MNSARASILALVSILLTLSVSSDNSNEAASLRTFIDVMVNDTINEWVEAISEPIEFSGFALELTNDLIVGSANISEFSLTGLSSLVATSIATTLLPMSLNATLLIPKITLNTTYNVDLAIAALLPFYGDGQLGVTIENAELLIASGLNTTDGFALYDLSIALSLGDAVFDFLGLMNNEAFSTQVSELLTNNVAAFINEYRDVISDTISSFIERIINGILQGNQDTPAIVQLKKHIELAMEEVTPVDTD